MSGDATNAIKPNGYRMPDSNTPLILVVCNDYGELALAMYLIGQQSFAQNTTLMLPPKLHAQNPDILPGRTFVYHSLADIQARLDNQPPGVLGLFSGYLLPIHRLCTVDELDALLHHAQAQDWKHFTSDPFLALLEDVDASELVTLTAPKWNIIWSYFAAKEKKRLSQLLTEANRVLNQTLHVYPCGASTTDLVADQSIGGRLHFHNSDFLSQPGYTPAAAEKHTQRWLFILGDQDYTVQEGKYGSTIWAQGMSRKFRKVLVRKLNEALEAGRVPTLIAPAKVIESVRKHSHAADAMELLGHCDYAHFQSLLLESEYVFYWNAVSFSCLVRTLAGKPWFTFDDGHLLRGMNTDYAKRIFDWFYQGGEPPRLDIETALTADSLLQATQQYLKPAWRVQQALLATADVQNLLSTLYPNETQPPQGSTSRAQPKHVSTAEAFQILQQLGEVISNSQLDGSCVVDSGLLAHSKSEITSAAALLIEHGATDQAEFARSAVPTLAFFQSGVGDSPHPIDSTSPDGKPWRAAVESDMLQIVGGLPKGPASNP
jgi:hypothetical protein